MTLFSEEGVTAVSYTHLSCSVSIAITILHQYFSGMFLIPKTFPRRRNRIRNISPIIKDSQLPLLFHVIEELHSYNPPPFLKYCTQPVSYTHLNNMNYKRFRHFGKDKVFMDFSFFAIAVNIKKMCAKMTKEAMDWLIRPFCELTVALFRCCEHIKQRNPQNIAA